MGWPQGHPEEGDYDGVDDAKAVMVRLTQWLQTAGEVVSLSAHTAGQAWEGPAMEAFGEAAMMVTSTVYTNAGEADAAATTLRSASSTMEEHIFPKARTAQISKKSAEEDLIRAQERLARDLAVDPSGAFISAEVKRVRPLDSPQRSRRALARLERSLEQG